MTKRKTTSAKKSKRTRPRKAGAKKRVAAPPVAIEPSHHRGDITARRMGRPARLTKEFIARFIEKLALGLHLEHAAALVGARGRQVADWLCDGRRDLEKGKDTVAAEFSVAVEAELARLVNQELGSLAVYQRIAEGWSPTCPRCLAKQAPCGRHRKNLKLAADLARWKLVHRFPRHWNASTVRHEIGSGDDGGGPAVTTPGDESARPAMVAGLVVFMPRRNEGI